MTRNRSNRRGVTLIEVMVAMALTLVIMLILAEAFKSSLDFVRSANSTGGMISQLNGAGTILGRDLKAEHFLPEDDKPTRGVHLSDQRLDWRGTAKGWNPPRGGFFKIYAPAPSYEAYNDQEGFRISWAENHQLHFTAILPGGSDQNLFTTRSGAGTFTSRAAEVAYFLVQTGTTGPGGRRLFNLIRRYRLVALDDEVGTLTPASADSEAISVPSPNPSNTVNTLAMVAAPANRMALNAFPVSSARYGEDILLSNVLSFEVLADWTPHPTQGGSNQGPANFAANSEAPYDYLFQGGGVFDTTNPPQSVRIKSLQVTIRVYDPRMRQARQNTWKFAM